MAEKQNTPEIRFEGFTDPWEQRKLGELCELNPTAVLPDSFEYVDLESVAGTDMISHRREEKLTAPSRAQRLASFGDIFYQTVRPYQKNNYFYELPDEDYVFSTGYAQLRPLCDGRFLFSSLQRDQFVSCVLEHCTGTSYPAINANDLAALFLAVPIDAEEQRLVGSILKPIDSLITLHQRECGKPPFNQSPAWEQRKLSEVATFGGGHTPSMADSDNYEDGCVLWVTSQDVKSSYLDRTTTQITEKGAKKLTLYPAGSLVMVTRSGILRHTLPVAELRKPSTVNQDIRVILPQDTCCGGWLLQFFISRNKELLLEFGKTGTTVESVDFGKIKDMLLRMPSSVEQQQIGRYFAQLDSLITLHQRMCPIFSFCAHGSRTNFAQTLQGWLQILRYPRPIPKMLVSPSAPASGVFGTAKGAFICASSSAGASTSSPSARKNFITSSTLCCRESLSSP